ncbi:MAG TPA: SWIM zinc finger family protein [Streptosporangiaceae bacterium]|nr:SWIM zinc finger family protein [Streptosporangiaceae bacterium]
MQSEHGDRRIALDGGVWSCSCDFFAQHGTCSHVMSLEMILRSHAGIRLAPDEPEQRRIEPCST